MTLVILKFAVPEAAGQQPSAGALRWTPTKRRTAGDWVVMPAGFTVPLVNGEATVEVAPTGADWVWRVDEHVPTTQGGSRYVAVPDLEEIDYTDLIAVDPKTLDPSDDPDPAWYAYVDTLEGQAATASASAVSAKIAAEAAQLSATGSETSAAASAATATTKASEASTSATNAAGSAASALTYKNDAADSADLAGRTGLTMGTVTTVDSFEAASATITGANPDRVLNLSIPHGPANELEIGEVITVPGTPLDDEIVAEQIANGTFTAAALLANFVAGETRLAEGSQTNGQNIILGSFGYIQTGGATNSVSGGSPNYENVIGGNTSNVNTATSNLTGAPTLVAPNGNWNSIWGGYDNVCNGWANQVQGYHTVIETGANHCTIAGGSAHDVDANVSYGTIGGGTQNRISATQGTVGGGSTNTANGISSTIGGGITNTATGAGSTIGGGTSNSTNGSNATVGGGTTNQASNTTATVGGGASNQASNINATVAGGSANIASGNGATISGGLTNTASGTSATVLGGRDNVASSSYSTVYGREALADVIGMTSYANGKFTAVGDAQAVNYVLRRETTDATSTQLYTDGVGTFMGLPVDTTIAFEILVVARRTDVDGESAAYRITGCADRGAGSTGALVGTPVVTVLSEDNAAWDVTVTAATSGSIRVAVTGEAGKTIRWVARANLVSVTG